MKRWLFFVYGVVNHLLFLAVFAYLMGFVGNFLVPKSIDSPTSSSVPTAIAVNLLLLVIFGVQHSVMARPGFKRAWTQIIPTPIERSTYLLISNVVTILLIWQWQAINIIVWDVQNDIARVLLWGLFAAGWLLVPAASLMINHFDLFGTRQVWLYLSGREYVPLPFRTPMLYRYIRHPLYVGWAIAFWATPTMSVGHLLFAGFMTGYMALAALVEERDLVVYLGSQYEEYQRRVPRYLPRLFGRS
jgi:protein-S-isoprenylcysteine O-methyltransferase Ste14